MPTAQFRPKPHFPRSLSAGCNTDGNYPLLHDMRHTQSLPASYPSTIPWRQKKHALTGPLPPAQAQAIRRAIRPSTTSPRPAHVRPPPRQMHGVPLGGIPMRRGRGTGAQARSTSDDASPVIRPRRLVGLGIDLAGAFEHALYPIQVVTIGESLSDEGEATDFSNGANDDEMATYSFTPPGLSSPQSSAPANEPNHAQARRDSMTPPGAPLLPSVSRLGSHFHATGLDHRPGGDADEDAFTITPLLTPARPTRPRSYTHVPSGTRLPMSRLATFHH